MPIDDIRFEDGIFYCKESGRVDKDDAQLWAEKAQQFASQTSVPIVALVDATDATYITAAARQIFARATAIANLHDAAVATDNFLVEQNAQLISVMSVDRHTHIFNNLADAQQFARERAQLLRDSYEARA